MNEFNQQLFDTQRRLSMLGLYSPKRLDGLMGRRTEAAMSEYSEFEGLKPTDNLDVHLYYKIRKMHPSVSIPDDIMLDFDSEPDPRQWSASMQQRFRDYANSRLLLAVKMLCEELYLNRPEHVAYIMATIQHETFGCYLPTREAWYVSARARKNYLSKQPYSAKRPDEPSFEGRGYVQLTWQSNYMTYERITGAPLTERPEMLCTLTNETTRKVASMLSLYICIHGFKTGAFTGRRLTDYINDEKCDWINARRVINGVPRGQTEPDQASKIKEHAEEWLRNLGAEVNHG